MATYTVVPGGTGAFAVEIRHPGGAQITGGFRTEAEAKAWMVERQAEDAKRGKKRAKVKTGRAIDRLQAAACGIAGRARLGPSFQP